MKWLYLTEITAWRLFAHEKRVRVDCKETSETHHTNCKSNTDLFHKMLQKTWKVIEEMLPALMICRSWDTGEVLPLHEVTLPQLTQSNMNIAPCCWLPYMSIQFAGTSCTLCAHTFFYWKWFCSAAKWWPLPNLLYMLHDTCAGAVVLLPYKDRCELRSSYIWCYFVVERIRKEY